MDKKKDDLDESLKDNSSNESVADDTNNLDSTNEETNNNLNNNIINKLKLKLMKEYDYTKILLSFISLALISLIVISIIGLKNDKTMINQGNAIPTWEYKVVSIEATEDITYIQNELNPTEVQLTEDMINTYGVEGWELVDSYLEVETVHPNYGNDEYVTGLQPNVRPQRLVLIFKKPL